MRAPTGGGECHETISYSNGVRYRSLEVDRFELHYLESLLAWAGARGKTRPPPPVTGPRLTVGGAA